MSNQYFAFDKALKMLPRKMNNCGSSSAVVIEKEAVVMVIPVVILTVGIKTDILPSVGSYSQMKRLVRNLTTKAEEDNRKTTHSESENSTRTTEHVRRHSSKNILNRIYLEIRAFVPRHIICALSQYMKSETEVHSRQLIMLLTVSACRPDIHLHWQHVYFNSSSSVDNHQETKRTQPP